MIRYDRLRPSLLLTVGVLTAALAAATFLTPPSAALAAGAVASLHAVTLDVDGKATTLTSTASTVGTLLHRRGITLGKNDYVYPAAEVPVSDGLVITYRRAVSVMIAFAHSRRRVVSSAQSVADLLDQQHVTLDVYDRVVPALDAPVPPRGTIRIWHVVTWKRRVRQAVGYPTIYRLDHSNPAGEAKVVAAGSPGVRVVVIGFTRRDGGPIHRRIVRTYFVHRPRPRIIDDGVGSYGAFGSFARRSASRIGFVAQSQVQMVATAYTAHCYGCSGITATGHPAGPGIVAVDPRVIPLGSRLYIPGYGFAIAGDTGGDIRGDRVDLGFASYDSAIRFGCREVTVYRLK